MAQNVDEFWFGSGPGASEEDLSATEAYVGHRLPPLLRQLLLERDGGVSNFSAFEDGDEYFPLPPLFGVSSTAAADTISSAFRVGLHFGVPTGVVPFAGMGHSWMGLDYRQGDDPSVVYRQEEETAVELVARTFEAFLAGLIEE